MDELCRESRHFGLINWMNIIYSFVMHNATLTETRDSLSLQITREVGPQARRTRHERRRFKNCKTADV
jgi:hypothetical protein